MCRLCDSQNGFTDDGREKKSNEVSDMRICRFNLMNETKPTDEQEHCRKNKQNQKTKKTSDEPSM